MKNHYKLIKTLVVLAMLGFANLNAQVATLYTFSQLSGTYAAVTGGTLFGTTSSDDDLWANGATPQTWNNQGPGVNIGFNFMFNNHVYDRIGICNNGWIVFGSSALIPAVDMYSNYGWISGYSAAIPIQQNGIAACAYDIRALSSGASLRAETIGTAPTRTFVVQWNDYQKYSSGSGDLYDFQIRLMETTNIVEVYYGSAFVANGSSAFPEVGLRGDSNADYNNRIVNSTNTWPNSIPGTSNFSSTQINSSLFPSSQIYRWTPPQCSGSLSNLNATGNTTLVCPNGGVNLGLLNSYTVSGIVYSWSQSTSSGVGPWTALPNSNAAAYNATGVTVPTWYINYATCINGGAPTATSTAFNVQVAATTVSTVPYYEDFEGITMNNELPNCSWVATNIPSVSLTYTSSANQNRVARSGNKFASFRSAYINGTNYFFSNGLQLNSGVTYSASAWYTTDFYGYTNTTSLTLGFASAQTAVTGTAISIHSPAASPIYKAISGTFTVPTSGIYYMYISATSNGNYGTPYLSWDDLAVIVPCSLNASTVIMTASQQTICLGESINLNATGADTYTWSTGATGDNISETPSGNTLYYVTGTSSLSGCSFSTQTQMITVNPSPNVFAYAANPIVCSGQVVNLVASGADTYMWTNNNMTTPLISVNPTVSTNYVVVGTNSYNCTKSQTVAVTVNPLPVIVANGPADICKGEVAILSGTGADTYQFASNSIFVSGSPASVSPNMSTTFTVTGTSTLGCVGKTTFALNVNECVGLKELTALSGVAVYPNPTSGMLTVEVKNDLAKNVVVTDVTGRVVMSANSNDEKIAMNMAALANGIYYVKIQSANAVEVVKIVKN